MQRFSNVTDVVAEVLPHGERPWQTVPTPFHSAHGYIGDFLPDCEPEKVLPDLVMHVVQRESGAPEWQSMQTVMISTMHWLQSAGAAGLGSILSDVPLSFSYDALIQSLCLIRKPLAACDMYLLYKMYVLLIVTIATAAAAAAAAAASSRKSALLTGMLCWQESTLQPLASPSHQCSTPYTAFDFAYE